MREEILSASRNYGIALSPGQRLCGARFLLKRLIGGGEISEVWLARDVPTRKDVVLKLIPSFLLSDKNLMEHLAEEVRRTRLLQHPHIVPTIDLVSDRRSAAIVTEHVDGWSLAALKVDKLCCCYTVEEIKPWIRQVGEALAHAHNAFGLVHGDLKSSNLLLNEREGIKVSDFGFAAMLRTESARRGLAQGIYKGIGLLSPQQVMGGTPSKLDDIYSLGATIFDLLTGTPPFNKGEIIAQICSLPPPTITQRLRELDIQDDPISPVWETTVAACLAKNPADRPQDVNEVMRLLERTEVPEPTAPPSQSKPDELEEMQEPVAEPEPTPEPIEVTTTTPSEMPSFVSSEPSRTPAKLVGVLVTLAVVVLAAAFWFAHNSPASSKNNAVAAVHLPGSLDKSFNVGAGANDQIRSLAVQPDGKILIGGLFTQVGNVKTHKFARLNPDGSVEPHFPWQPSGVVHALAVQSDGKFIAAGEAMLGGNRMPNVHVVRVQGDGQREADWGLFTKFNREIRTIAIQPDGKVLLGGSFTWVSKRHPRRLLRLKSDGSLDDGFHTGSGADAIVWAIAVQPEGKILVGGAFKNFNGRHEQHLVRLNADGSFDPGFKNVTGADGDVLAIVPQADGKILIGGKFGSVDGVACPHIARLNADGTVDPTFHPGTGPDSLVESVAVQSDGKIIVGGGFGTVDGKSRGGVARLNADGTLDESFKVGEGASGFVWKVAVQPDGKILAAGNFDSFDGVPCGRIVRLEN